MTSALSAEPAGYWKAPTSVKIADVADPTIFAKSNTMLLRNTSVGNFFDLCGVSLPLPAPLPVGLMLMGRNGQDRALLRIAAVVEEMLAAERG